MCDSILYMGIPDITDFNIIFITFYYYFLILFLYYSCSLRYALIKCIVYPFGINQYCNAGRQTADRRIYSVIRFKNDIIFPQFFPHLLWKFVCVCKKFRMVFKKKKI